MRERRHAWWVPWLFLVALAAAVRAKVYDRCELAMELHDRFKFSKRDIDKWLCLAYWESRFDTRAYHKGKYDGSGDHGIFQINDKHWCQPHEGYSENVCRIPCYLLRDDNLYDDVECVNKIFRRHGFHAWIMFSHKCAGNTMEFFSGCDFRMRRGDVGPPAPLGPSPSGLQITIEPPPILDKLSQMAKGIYQAGGQEPSAESPSRRSPGEQGQQRLPVQQGLHASQHEPQRLRVPQRWVQPENQPRKPPPPPGRRQRRPPVSLPQPQHVAPAASRRRPLSPPPRPILPVAVPVPQDSISTVVVVQPGQRRPPLRRPLPPRLAQKQPLPFLLPPSSGAPTQAGDDLFGLHEALGPLSGPLMGPLGGSGGGGAHSAPPLPMPVHVPPPSQMVVFKKTRPRRLFGGLRLRPFLGYERAARSMDGEEDDVKPD